MWQWKWCANSNYNTNGQTPPPAQQQFIPPPNTQKANIRRQHNMSRMGEPCWIMENWTPRNLGAHTSCWSNWNPMLQWIPNATAVKSATATALYNQQQCQQQHLCLLDNNNYCRTHGYNVVWKAIKIKVSLAPTQLLTIGLLQPEKMLWVVCQGGAHHLNAWWGEVDMLGRFLNINAAVNYLKYCNPTQ